MVDGGIDFLLEYGLGPGTERATLKSVFDYLLAERDIRLHYASVLGRIWPDQAAYQGELAAAIARIDTDADSRDTTIAHVLDLILASDRSTEHGRWRALEEIARLVARESLEALATSRQWPIFVGVWAVEVSRPSRDPEDPVHLALVDNYEQMTASYTDAYASLAELLGMRFRAPLTARHFTIAVSSLAEGCALREAISAAETHGIVIEGDGGEPNEWTLFGIGLDALMRRFLEPIPDWIPTDLELEG